MTNFDQRTMASWPSPPTHRGFSIADFFEAWEATAPPASSAKRFAWISWDDQGAMEKRAGK